MHIVMYATPIFIAVSPESAIVLKSEEEPPGHLMIMIVNKVAFGHAPE